MVLSILTIMYLGYVKPIVDKWHLAFELIDEFIILAICYCMLQFSDYYPDDNVRARYKVGTAVNALVVFHIVYRLTVMIVDLLLTIYRIIRAWLGKRTPIPRKEVPEREEKDLHYPFDVTEFETQERDVMSKQSVELKLSEYWLSPFGHPRYVPKNRHTEPLAEIIDEYSCEETIEEQSEIELLEYDDMVIEVEADAPESIPLNAADYQEPLADDTSD